MDKTSQEIQAELIKTYIKPTLKSCGYKTSGRTWWKDLGDFFTVINLQTSQWSNKEKLSFCLNIGIGLTSTLAEKGKVRPTQFDAITYLRQNAFLSAERLEHLKKCGGGLGYVITRTTNLDEFVADFKIDFEGCILHRLDTFRTLQDCVAFHDRFEFWGGTLRRIIEENGICIDNATV